MKSIVRGAVVLVVGCVALRGASAGWYRTVNVPGNYPTIQAAVDAVVSHATIQVEAGNYGPVRLPAGTEDLTLRGGPDAVIDGGALPAIAVIDSRNVVIDGFTVVSRGDGVRVVRGTDDVVQNVTVRSAGGAGITIDTTTNVLVTNNRVESAGGTGIRVVATTAEVWGPLTVTSNTVLTAHGDGIVVHNIGDGADMVVSDNVVTNVDGRGIRTECGMTLVMARNDVSRTGGDAVSIWAVNGPTQVTDNAVADSRGSGIDVSGSQRVVVSDNSVDRTGADGVAIAGPDVRVDRNTITGAGDAGVRILEADASYNQPMGRYPGESVQGNVIAGPAGAGIVLDHVRPLVVADNTISDPGLHGIELDGARGVRVTKNAVTGARACGFILEGGARGNVLAQNTASDCVRGFSAGRLRGRNRIASSNRFGRRR